MTSDHPVKRRKKLIEVAIPLAEVNDEAARRNIKAPLGWPTSIHKWWAQRPIAIARAVLLAQILDDPSECSDEFPGAEAQAQERSRLLEIIAAFSDWDNTKNAELHCQIETEVEKSLKRSGLKIHDLRFLDPFAGGACIPISAQLLGIQTEASDLNPVSCLINISLGEIPYRVSNYFRSWSDTSGMQGIGKTALEYFASRVLHFSEVLKEKALAELQNYYPDIYIPNSANRGLATPVAYIWARSVPSPNPKFSHVQVPLASNFVLCNRSGKETYLQPVIDGDQWRLAIARGPGDDFKRARNGTKIGRGGNFRCVLSGDTISSDYIKLCGEQGSLRSVLMAVVVDGALGRDYIEASSNQEEIAASCPLHHGSQIELPQDPRNFWIAAYGYKTFDSLFSARQTHTLHVLISQLDAIKPMIMEDAIRQNIPEDVGSDNHISREEYVRCIRTYLMLIISRVAYYGSTLNGWLPKDNALGPAMPRQTIPMSWDFAEANPFGKSSGGISACANVITKALISCNPRAAYRVYNRPAQTAADSSANQFKYIISTDPPYYDNIAYADLSDFFYQWLRLGLKAQYPELFKTLSTPKTVELVATPYRHQGKDNAEKYFLEGMKEVFSRLSSLSGDEFPMTIYYSFKQSESDSDGSARRTGWEAFLAAVLSSGLEITATWPLRAERKGRMLAAGTNALASCILLVCRKKDPTPRSCTRADFRREARLRIKEHLLISEQLSIPPVDYAQIAVGVGISVFSSYSAVFSVDDSVIGVGDAISDIQSALDDILSGDEGEYDKDTQFAIYFFESYGYTERPYGDAELLAKAKNVSVDGVIKSGALASFGGSVALVRRDRLDSGWDPKKDKRLCVWEATQHLIKRLEIGESYAAELLVSLRELYGSSDFSFNCRALAYRLYNHCEKTKQAEEARAYNGLVIAWPELEKLAAQAASPVQPSLL